ncbi:MAG TPA: protein-glutamate O-methyltransferase CheR [Roseiflexaceae bacterium]|nr:protein-glutamate O-methyltransferase CheR [Roseiflexaceae bacterium]
MEPFEYSYVTREILGLTGIDLSHYKQIQVQRRLTSYLLRSGHPTWPSLFRAVRGDSQLAAQLRDYLTINVSAFFRDPAKYAELRRHILPELLGRRETLRVWSAGCSYGQEPYSLAIMLAELGAGQRHRILATDIDRVAVERTRAGGPYTPDDVAAVPQELLQRHFTPTPNGYWVSESLRHVVVARQHNLLADSIDGGFDLIVCRNVVIYFTEAAKERLYRRFAQALRPGGMLFVGGTEVIARAASLGLELARLSFYRRVR